MTAIGKIRRSQVISSFGPGAIINFRSNAGAPISAVSGGLDLWEEARLDQRQRLHEVRLLAHLGVDFFYEPPIGKYKTAMKDAKGRPVHVERALPTVRFPEWCFCSQCYRLKKADQWDTDMASGDLWCPHCSSQRGRARRKYVVPVRFVVACEQGHLDEFPWSKWVGHADGCKKPDLRLKAHGAGLAGLVVSCNECGAQKSLAKAYGPHAMERIGHRCSGRRPWAPDAHAQSCSHPAVVIQRGASNAYFPIVESSIDIPPFTDEFSQFIRQEQFWKSIKALKNLDQLRGLIEDLELDYEWPGKPMRRAEMEKQIRLVIERDEAGGGIDLRSEEYESFTSVPSQLAMSRNFKIEKETVPKGLNGILGSLVRVERLREVRALTGFTRVTPNGQEKTDREPAKLSGSKKNWLPAVQVFGEGIFLTLDIPRLLEWEQREEVRARIKKVNEALSAAALERGGDPLEPWPLTARHILVHTISHALIERLSLDCGYSSSSVRERLYVGPEGSNMAGLLIYTSAPGADGTLGGLSREGREDRFGTTFQKAIQDTRWCSADPLCSDGIVSIFDGGNGAACHSCCFLPETSCEHFNQFLDRALVSGGIGTPRLGFVTDYSAGAEHG